MIKRSDKATGRNMNQRRGTLILLIWKARIATVISITECMKTRMICFSKAVYIKIDSIFSPKQKRIPMYCINDVWIEIKQLTHLLCKQQEKVCLVITAFSYY
ncbi:hypothetical protein CW304_07655 [Bacillus sp. UFRGS-B20]|nr:hypothetical protein CW304_07655 [Bacillus sp. UFRGS-B20]